VLSAQFPSNEFGGCRWKRVSTRLNVFGRSLPARNSFAGDAAARRAKAKRKQAEKSRKKNRRR
jgi:hypothetical protein